MLRWTSPILLLAALVAGAAVAAADEFRGLPLERALARLETRGLSILYSSDLVTAGLIVTVEPSASDPRKILAEIARPLGLAVVPGPGGAAMLVRASGSQATAGGATAATLRPLRPASASATEVEEIVVSASRYRLYFGPTAVATELSASDTDVLPAIGEDPVRSVERLPGVARQDFTSKPNLRGGVADETLVRFDGVRLYNPFHMKDFQSVFSTIDPGVVSGLTVYTAGFPVMFGDRMSGVMDIVPIEPGEGLHGRVAGSLFNVGARVNDSFDEGRGHWVASARRGLLDKYIALTGSDLGDPTYMDYYGHLDHRVGDSVVVSGSALVFKDDLQVFDSDQEEEAEARYVDKYFWLQADYGDAASGGRVQAARSLIESHRFGTVDLPGVTRGSLDDRRSFTIDSLQADGWWPVGVNSVIETGGEWRHSSGHYEYRDVAEFALLFRYPGAPQEPSRSREFVVNPSGDQYAAYLNWRVAPSPELALDVGLRWEALHMEGVSDGRLAPRAGLLWIPDSATRLRASWGRFNQAQGIDELQVSDGETRFFPAQQADHWVASAERQIGREFNLRLEAYRKNYRRLRPRYENLLDSPVVLPGLRPDRIRIEAHSATADGAELTLEYGEGSALEGRLSYSWSKVTDAIDGQSVRRSWDQTHFVSAGVTHRGLRWDLSLAAIWHSGWPTTAVELATLEPFPLVATGPRNERSLGDYARLDLRVARNFALSSGQSLTVFLDVSNLTNRRNDCCIEYQLETDSTPPYLDVGPLESLPFIPSIGFVWEF
ncbi:MAG: TonB-dependent receptor [Steroidobacteraceae bacterium]